MRIEIFGNEVPKRSAMLCWLSQTIPSRAIKATWLRPSGAMRYNRPSFVYKEPFPVRGPVGGLNEEGKFADDLVGAALEVVDFQAAGYVLCHSRMKGCDKQE